MTILSDQFKSYQATKTFSADHYDDTHTSNMASKVITKDLAAQISAAEFEAAAISAAMAMEKNAIRFYSERSETATDQEEKALYKWLAEWEHQHLSFLAAIDKELTEKIWYDNSFWPF
jgi:rubrerythrin